MLLPNLNNLYAKAAGIDTLLRKARWRKENPRLLRAPSCRFGEMWRGGIKTEAGTPLMLPGSNSFARSPGALFRGVDGGFRGSVYLVYHFPGILLAFWLALFNCVGSEPGL